MRASISKLHRTLMFVSLIVPQTESSLNVVGQRPVLLLMGDDGQGGRYYGTLVRENWQHDSRELERYVVDGYTCNRIQYVMTPNPSKYHTESVEEGLQVFTVREKEGYSRLLIHANIFADRIWYYKKAMDTTVLCMGIGPLHEPTKGPQIDLMFKPFEDLYNDGKLLYLETTTDKPAANSVYYGFCKDGFDIRIDTDENGKIKSVKTTNGTRQLNYNQLVYTMFGKAMMIRLSKMLFYTIIITEPADKDKFDGTRESFSAARLDTLEGNLFLGDICLTCSES